MNHDFWDNERNIFRTRKGGWVIGEAVYCHGYNMMTDLIGRKSFFQVLVLNVTGRMPERKLADWLEASFICLSWPDPRIWCNHIGSLAGTARTTPVAAACAGSLAADSRMYGSGTLLAGTRFITGALAKKKAGMSAEEIVEEHLSEQRRLRPHTQPVIVGYARPLATGDERVVAMEKVAEELGFGMGEHLSLGYDIHAILLDKYGEGMNLVGYCTAFLADHGFSAKEIYRIYSLWVNSGIHACYAEAYDNPPEAFLPLRCEDIEYQGKPPRKLPNSTR